VFILIALTFSGLLGMKLHTLKTKRETNEAVELGLSGSQRQKTANMSTYILSITSYANTCAG